MKKRIALIVPCYNEEDSLPYFLRAIDDVRKKLASSYSLDFIFINDGSSDSTQSIIEGFSNKKDHFYWRQLAHNAGHQSALRAGLDVATEYDAAIMMDADLQHPPQLIPDMLRKWSEGVKIVQMVREDSVKEAGHFKYLTSKSYYWFINKISGLELSYGASDFRLIDQVIIDAVSQSRENNLFLRGYFSWLPVSKVTIAYKPNKRVAGKSKYSFKKMLNLAYEGVVQFSERPLQLSVVIGIALAFLSFIYGVVIIIQKLSGASTVSGWTSVMVVMLFCFGINFILIGIVGAYMTQALRLEKQRPEFIIEREKLPRS